MGSYSTVTTNNEDLKKELQKTNQSIQEIKEMLNRLPKRAVPHYGGGSIMTLPDNLGVLGVSSVTLSSLTGILFSCEAPVADRTLLFNTYGNIPGASKLFDRFKVFAGIPVCVYVPVHVTRPDLEGGLFHVSIGQESPSDTNTLRCFVGLFTDAVEEAEVV
jgi:hypothetical protein